MFKFPKIILSILVLFVVIFASIQMVNNTPKIADAGYSNSSESKTKDSWLAITNVSPKRVDGYFCARRKNYIGKDEPLDLTVSVDGKQIGSYNYDSYNSMNPFEENCDLQDRNSFSFYLDYKPNCKKDKLAISVKSRVNGQSNTVKRSIDNPQCETSNTQSKTYQSKSSKSTKQPKTTNVKTKINKSSKNKESNSYKYLTVSNCVNGNRFRIPVFGVSYSSNDYPSCGNLESSYVASKKLNRRYVHIAVCRNMKSNLDLDYITKMDISDSMKDKKLCSGNLRQIEYYTVDTKYDRFLTISNCTARNDSYDIFPSIVSKTDYNPNFENCSQYYPGRYSTKNYVLTI